MNGEEVRGCGASESRNRRSTENGAGLRCYPWTPGTHRSFVPKLSRAARTNAVERPKAAEGRNDEGHIGEVEGAAAGIGAGHLDHIGQ